MIEPIEFDVGKQRLRHSPLAAMTLVREHGRLIKRADMGALDLLALQLTATDQERLLRMEPTAVFTVLQALARFVGEDDLDALLAYYIKLGSVEIRVEMPNGARWEPLTDERNVALLDDPFHIYDAVWPVLRGLFAPLERALLRSSEGAKEPASGSSSSMTSETTSPSVPTSPTTS